MALTRAQKKKVIEDLKEKIERQKAIIFIDFAGLKVRDLSDLRRRLKATDCQLKVAKKTLMAIAFKLTKLDFKPKKLQGEVALVFGYKEPLAPAKIVYQFTKINPNLKILGGFIENQKSKFLNPEEIIELAKLPTREELLTRLVGSISAPISNFINILEGNIKGLINVLAKAKA
jgi:large subunit ribosomal protein L10